LGTERLLLLLLASCCCAWALLLLLLLLIPVAAVAAAAPGGPFNMVSTLSSTLRCKHHLRSKECKQQQQQQQQPFELSCRGFQECSLSGNRSKGFIQLKNASDDDAGTQAAAAGSELLLFVN
jgi:hypothetical protein